MLGLQLDAQTRPRLLGPFRVIANDRKSSTYCSRDIKHEQGEVLSLNRRKYHISEKNIYSIIISYNNIIQMLKIYMFKMDIYFYKILESLISC